MVSMRWVSARVSSEGCQSDSRSCQKESLRGDHAQYESLRHTKFNGVLRRQNSSTATFSSAVQKPLLPVNLLLGPHLLSVRVSADHSRGLLGSPGLAPGTGMLFLFSPPSTIRSFHMRGMQFPIDLAYIKNKTITQIFPHAQPESVRVPLAKAKHYPSHGPVDAALELPAGWCARNHVGVGEIVRW